MQPELFEIQAESASIDAVLLYALGDFQTRGKLLAGRPLPLDRLHGAFLRAFSKFGIGDISDAEITAGLKALGVQIVELPGFVAKRPYRITVSHQIAAKALTLCLDENRKQTERRLERNDLRRKGL